MGKSPSYARILLGTTIQRLRKAAGLTQTELGAMVGMDQPKIARIEKAARGTVNIDPADLNRIFDALKVGHELAEELRTYARAPYEQGGTWTESGSQAWWNGKLRAEALARQYFSFHIESWDGLAQTEAYMRRQFQLGGRTNVNAATATRLERQRHVFDEPTQPGFFHFIVTDAALARDMGEPEVLAGQLEHGLALMERGHVKIEILPFSAAVPVQVADFTIMRFGSRVMSDLVLVEDHFGATISDGDDAVTNFQTRWDRIRQGIDPEQDPRNLIQQRIEQLRAT